MEAIKMPRGDGTGPNGQGPMTGRGMGFCAGFNMPGFMNAGFGRGRGFRRRFVQPVMVQEPVEMTGADEKKVLEAELKELAAEKADIEKRLKELK
jgi:hypothetical protein